MCPGANLTKIIPDRHSPRLVPGDSRVCWADSINQHRSKNRSTGMISYFSVAITDARRKKSTQMKRDLFCLMFPEVSAISWFCFPGAKVKQKHQESRVCGKGCSLSVPDAGRDRKGPVTSSILQDMYQLIPFFQPGPKSHYDHHCEFNKLRQGRKTGEILETWGEGTPPHPRIQPKPLPSKEARIPTYCY